MSLIRWEPFTSADISETEKEFLIRAELPADAIHCESRDGVLTVHIPKAEG